MAVPVTDPFGITAPDGNIYFKVLGPPRGLALTYELMLRAILNYRRASGFAQRGGDARSAAIARARAEMIERALGRMRAELTAMGNAGALMAREKIRNNITSTQVRPDPPKHGKRLIDLIVCRPIQTGLPSGSIGIADVKVLDHAAYWRAQEFGYTIKSRRIIPGFFMPGNAPPDPAQFRQHPIFQQEPYARGMPALNLAPGTQIALERKYLRDAVAEVAQWRFGRLERVQRDAIALLERASAVSATAIGPRGVQRRPGRRR